LAQRPDPIDGMNLIVTVPYGRAGSLLLQSLFDGHSNVVTLPYFGPMYGLIPASIADLDRQIDWFVATFPAVFDTSKGYFGAVGDTVSGKFGPNGDEDLIVAPAEFKTTFLAIAKDYAIGADAKSLSRREFFICAHLAYGRCARRLDVAEIEYIFYDPHTADEWKPLLDDFPGLYFIAMTRDPRQDWTSWRKLHSLAMRRDISRIPPICLFLSEYKYSKFSHALIGLIERLPVDHVRVIDLEMLHVMNRTAIVHLCGWLGIAFDECLMQSTFNGRLWSGNATNLNKASSFNPKMTRDAWRKDLPETDRHLIEMLVPGSIKFLGYDERNEIKDADPGELREKFRYASLFLLIKDCFLYNVGSPLVAFSKVKRTRSIATNAKRKIRKALAIFRDFLLSVGLAFELKGRNMDEKLREISDQQQHLLRQKLPPQLKINHYQ
jgi:hypothetical protein